VITFLPWRDGGEIGQNCSWINIFSCTKCNLIDYLSLYGIQLTSARRAIPDPIFKITAGTENFAPCQLKKSVSGTHIWYVTHLPCDQDINPDTISFD